MRHGKKGNHLGRTASHRKAMLSNMASSLIIHKRIETTLAKAKELRQYVEPLLTRAKEDSTHNRRVVFSYLNDKESTKELFGVVSDKIASRPGGYTRIIKLGNRLGDAAETALIELVDFNDALLLANADKPAKTRRSRRGGKKEGSTEVVDAAPVKKEDHPVVAETEPVVDEAPAANDEPTETNDSPESPVKE
ncbi:50S ribosomal protein L17 [Dyadobacter sp. CY326]|uniref:50S ribosomal protein L17 n=1 Tax=Dyadobacter sp. CY326 TaxID=2907300 RepID=UPI001F180BF1|nr:50S ribosomal protein L17 [Dyadobacter sp. CY326]MCE7067830.1 50S ribosomal protein L17 [Dyadobacter sp. CY326]